MYVCGLNDISEKQVMYFNQQHSALEVCFVYFEIVVI